MTAPNKNEGLIARLESLSALEPGWYANVGKKTGEQCCEAMREAARAIQDLEEEVGRLTAVRDALLESGAADPKTGMLRFAFWNLDRLNKAFDLGISSLASTAEGEG